MATDAEIAARVKEVNARIMKIGTEISTLQGTVTTLNQQIADLQVLVSSGGSASPELAAAVDEIAATAQAVDDQIPDAPPPV